jgi:hypothetical protein
MNGLSTCGSAACYAGAGAALVYSCAVPLAELTQGVGAKVLDILGASVPDVGVELAGAGAQRLLPATMTVTAVTCGAAALRGSDVSSGPGFLAQVAVNVVDPMVGIMTTPAGRALTGQQVVAVIGATAAGTVALSAASTACCALGLLCAASSAALSSPPYEGLPQETPPEPAQTQSLAPPQLRM